MGSNAEIEPMVADGEEREFIAHYPIGGTDLPNHVVDYYYQ